MPYCSDPILKILARVEILALCLYWEEASHPPLACTTLIVRFTQMCFFRFLKSFLLPNLLTFAFILKWILDFVIGFFLHMLRDYPIVFSF